MMGDQKVLKRIGGVLLVATVIALVVHFAILYSFNHRTETVHGNDADSAVNMVLATRDGNASVWTKKDFELNGQTVDMTGATFDGNLVNNSADTVSDWSLKLNITQDCYINQAWNGEVEIHQFVGTDKEKVQRLHLQFYELEDIELEYRYEGDLMIPLSKGDFVVYFPSQKYKEEPLAAGGNLEIGCIFYYLGDFDLSDYDLEYSYHRDFTQGVTFYVFALLLLLLLLVLLMDRIGVVTYKRAQAEMELMKSGLSCMSDLYVLIYIIDLADNRVIPVSVAEDATHEWRKSSDARRFLLDGVESSVNDAYKSIVREFVDIDTLAERLKSRDSVVCEFISKAHGWCSMRFFAMDRVEGRPLEKALFTVQDINEEKGELDKVKKRVSEAESESKAKSAFLANVSQELKEPIGEMVDLGGKIERESGEDQICFDARKLRDIGSGLLLLIDGVADYSELETGEIELRTGDYSLKQLLLDVVENVRTLTREQQATFGLEVSETLPDMLRGDGERLKRIVGNLLVIGASKVEKGSVGLSVFGKVVEGRVHLLVSVKAVCDEGSIADGPRNASHPSASTLEIAMGLAKGLLGLMGSELKEVRSSAQVVEYYFEVEQEIVDIAAVGKIG